MESAKTKKTKGPRRREIKTIKGKTRHATFTKRRRGLQKKTRKFCDDFDCDGAIFTFSKARNSYLWGHPHVKLLVDRYRAISNANLSAENHRLKDNNGGEDSVCSMAKNDLERRVKGAIKNGGDWDSATRDLDLIGLEKLAEEVEKVRRHVAEIVADKESSGEGRA